MKKILLTALILLSSCRASPETRSVLERSTCDLPCWNSIIPGQTTEIKLLQSLEASTDIDQKSIQNDNYPWAIFDNHISFSLESGWQSSRDSQIEVDVHILNSVVSDMVICGKLNTRIRNIVEQIGEPEFIISGDDLEGNRNVILMNPKVGVSYWYTTDKSLGESQYEITPNVVLQCINLFDPAVHEEMIEIGLFSMGHYNAEETLRVMYPWDGYGNLDEKYPPRQP